MFITQLPKSHSQRKFEKEKLSQGKQDSADEMDSPSSD